MKEDEVIINVKADDAYLIVWYRNKENHFHIYSGGKNGFCTEGSFPSDKTEEYIIRRIIDKHFEKRVHRTLSGEIVEDPPIFDELLFPEAMKLRQKLDERLSGQLDIFEEAI